MYHETTYREIADKRRKRIAVALVCLALCAILAVLAFAAQRISREQALVSIHDSVTAAAMQCAAVEGSYPSTLDHLEEYYGLAIDHDHYLVYYEWVADNIPPTVTVVMR